MRFVGNYALCGLSPQTDGMPVIPKKAVDKIRQPLLVLIILFSDFRDIAELHLAVKVCQRLNHIST